MRLPEEKEGKDTLISRVTELAGLVEYQNGSVVSRTIVDRHGGSVTVFAFSEGQGLSEHAAPFDALVQVIEGKVQVTISGKPYEVGTGQLIIMPANQPHSLKAIGRFKMMLVMIKD